MRKSDDPRTATKKEQWLCKDCGKDTYFDPKDYYMVKHEIWEKHGAGDGMLCVGCIEGRLGHKLTPEDLLDCPLNTIINPYTMSIMSNQKR